MRRVKHLLDRGGLALLAAVLVCGVTLLIGALAGDRPQQVSAAPPPPPGVAVAPSGCTPAPAATATATSTPTDTPTNTFVAPTATPTDTPTNTFVAPTATPTDTPTNTFVAPTATPTDTPTNTFVAPTATPTDTPTNTFAGVSAQAVGEPVGCWRMGEPSGTTMIDSSGNGNDGTYIGGVVLNQPGAVAGDTAALYDGVNDLGSVPDDNTLDVGSSLSLEGWIKRSSTTKTHSMMIKANAFQLVVMNAGSGSQVYFRKPNVTTLARSSGAVPADGAFHHIVATIDGNGATAKIYIDGVLDTVTVSSPQTLVNTTFPLTFGGTASTPATFDEFAVYDAPLTAAEVAAHYAAGI